MPYEGEFATGESLVALQRSEALRDFDGVIAVRDDDTPRDPPPIVEVLRNEWLPKKIVAIDGSIVTEKVQNGFPGAEASIVMLAVVFIDIAKLSSIQPDEIPSPKIFNEMDRAHALNEILPGSNIVRKGDDRDSPKRFFRAKVFDALSGKLDPAHETLIETARAISAGRKASIQCPLDGCALDYANGLNSYNCSCSRAEKLFETDAFRFHERFNELGSNGEVHGEVRHVLEVLSLVNILRFFESDDRIHFLKDCAFVLDGPLAVFGQPAWLAPYIRSEILRISAKAKARNGVDLLVMGVEKSGQYVSHFADIDWSDERGARSRFPARTALIPDAKYVNRNIVFRPIDAKPSGEDTYFGRKVFYKTRSEAHATLNLAMVNAGSCDFSDTSPAAFPRLGDALNILDHLSTYLYQDGFMPLVRAHAHAAIPLKRGTDIIKGLFEGQ